MRRYLTSLVAAAAYLVTGSARADEQILNVGDAAPMLTVSSWVKGEKVDQFEPGKMYVLDFWATWCGPCKASVPHLTELARKYKDKGVRFIGVDIWENDFSKVRPFVAKMGDQMDYSVALDDVSDNGNPRNGAMAKAWMGAAEEHTIPMAFVIQAGKIAWIGHPMRLDEPLAKITSGQWEPTAMVRARMAEKTKERKIITATKRITTPHRSGDFRGTLSAIEEVAASDPDLADQFASLRLESLCKLGETEEALKLAIRLLDKYRDQAMALRNTFARAIGLDLTQDPDPRLSKVGLQAARRANELTNGKNFLVLDTLAVAFFRNGDFAEALATEEKALKELDAQVRDKSQLMYKNYSKTFKRQIERFREKAAGNARKPGNP